jgi:trk system potassium uptake protein
MLVPFALDLADGDPNASGFLLAAMVTGTAGLGLAVASWRTVAGGLSRPQAFVVTVAVWTLLPAFGALPFVFAEPFVGYTDAFFESISGMTTTGSTVFTGLDDMPRGTLLWRSMLQWFGGLGIVIVAIIFLPVMRVGGMQFFHAVSMDVSGEIIPRATQIASDLLTLYLAISVLCTLGYAAAGMTAFDAICHMMATVSTGGYGTSDLSFGKFGPAAQYVSIVFMAMSAMPFVRFIELARGRPRALWRDTQVRAFLGIIAVASAIIAAAEIWTQNMPVEQAIRSAFFNVTSVVTTTGFANADYWLWSGLAVAVIFVVSMIGGCSGSTTGAAKVFRFQVLFSMLMMQIQRMRNPHVVHPLRYQGRAVPPDVVSAIMAFFFIYLVTLGVTAILLSLMGLDFLTALTAPVATITNVGPGLGPVIGPAGNFSSLPDAAKWLLSLAMLLGRLEFMSVLVLLLPSFWR